MLRHRSAVRDGHQTLGSHEVHVGGRGHGAGDSSSRRRGQTWLWLRKVRLALPWPRTTSAARLGAAKGAGARALPTRRSAKATSAPHLYVTGSASARSIHRPAPPRRRSRRRPAPRRARSPDGRSLLCPPSRLPWKDATRGGRKFIRLKTPPRRWERKLQERYTPSAASPSSQSPRTFR